MAKKLYLVWELDNGRDFTLALSDPKDMLAGATIKPIMQTAIDKSMFTVDGAKTTTAKDAYYREVTTTKINL